MNKKLLVIIFAVFISVTAITSVIILKYAKKNEANEQLPKTEDSEGTIDFSSNNKDELIASKEQLVYYDSNSGVVFHYPSEFNLSNLDEYFVLNSNTNKNGSIVIYAQSDVSVSDGVEVYEALHGLKERTVYVIDGGTHKCILYDGGNLIKESIGDKEIQTEYTTIYLKDLDPSLCDAWFYHMPISNYAICIGCITKSDSSEEDKNYFKSAVNEIINNFSVVEYTGESQFSGNAYEISMLPSKVFKFNIQVPSSWTESTGNSGEKIFKPITMKGDQYQGASFACSKTALSKVDDYNASSSYFECYNFMRYELGEVIGNAVCQNVTINNGFSFSSLYLNQQENVNINGYDFVKANYSGVLDLSRSKKISTLPEKKVEITAYYVTVDGYTYSFVFTGNSNNIEEMRILAERCLSVVR